MPANLSKRSIVKHRTRKPFHSGSGKKTKIGGEEGTGANGTSLGVKGKGRSGFQVGPKHAPDGAYLGRAKKIKADLIEKAKIKKRFFKSVNGETGKDTGLASDEDIDAMLRRDEGKFAPERGEEEFDDGDDILYQMRNREEVALKKDNGKEKGDKGRADRQPQVTQPANTTLRPDKERADEVLSKEDRQKIREKKTERWHSQSGSQKGRERGQPNLGARMDLLLERIKKTT